MNATGGAITMDATGADEGDIILTANDDATIDATGLISLDAAAASNITTSAGALTLEGDAGVVINSATSVGVTIDAATAGNVEINSVAGTILIGDDAVNGAINIGTGGVRTVTVGNTAATELQLDAILLDMNATGGAITMNATGGSTGDIFLNAVDDATIDATGLISLDAGEASNFTTSAGALTLEGDAGVVINSATSVGVTIDAATAGNVEINSAAGAINIGNDAVNGAVNIGTAGVRTISVGIPAATLLDLDAISLDVDAAGLLTLDGATGINIGDQADVAVDIDASTLVIDAATSVTATSPITSLVSSDYVEIKALTNAAELRFYEASDAVNRSYIALQAGAGDVSTTTPVTLTLPSEFPASGGQVLKSTTAGVLTWGDDETEAGATSNDNSFGTGLSSEEVAVTFNGTLANDGILSWPHASPGSGYFNFNSPVRLEGTKQLQLNDDGTYIYSSTDSQLDLVSDGLTKLDAGGNIALESDASMIFTIDNNSNTTDVFGFYQYTAEKAQINEAGDLQIDGQITIGEANGGTTIVDTDASNVTITKAITNLSGDIQVNGNDIKSSTAATAITLTGADVAVVGELSVGWLTGAAGGATISDAGVVTLTDNASFIIGSADVNEAELEILDGANVTTAELNLIDGGTARGTDAIADGDGVLINDGGTMKMTTVETLAAYLDASAATLTNKTLTSPKLNENVAVTTTATELNLIDGGTVRGTDAIADGDGVLINDGGTMKMTTVETLAAYLDDEITAMPALVTTAATTVGTISSGTWEGTDVAVAHGGTGVSTLADGGLVIGNAASAVEVVAAGLTTEILVGGGASTAPVWTTVTGTGAPVRAVSPTLTTPLLGTPTSGVATNLTGLPLSTGVTGTLKHENGGIEADISAIIIGGLVVGTGTGSMAILANAGAGDDGKVLTVQGDGSVAWEAIPGGRNSSSSDMRFKKNISTVSGALEKLSKLNPVNYDWRKDEFKNKGFNDKKQWGFIAQEVEKVMPELVGADKDDYLTLNYTGFVPLLTKAMQEQQTEIENQQKEIDELKAQLELIMKMMQSDMSDKTDNKKAENNEKPVKLSMATVK
jgi:hypothetical protein